MSDSRSLSQIIQHGRDRWAVFHRDDTLSPWKVYGHDFTLPEAEVTAERLGVQAERRLEMHAYSL